MATPILEMNLAWDAGITTFQAGLTALAVTKPIGHSIWASINDVLENHMIGNYEINRKKFVLQETSKAIKKGLAEVGLPLPKGDGGAPSLPSLLEFVEEYGKQSGFFFNMLKPGRFGIGSTEFMVRVVNNSFEGSVLHWGVNLDSFYEQYPATIFKSSPLALIGSGVGLVQFTEDQMLDVMEILLNQYFIPMVVNPIGFNSV